MHIWIDLANSPHVPFFHALVPEFTAHGHTVEISARDFAQTIELAATAGMMAHVVGGHGGGSITGKAGNLVGRAAALRKWARDRGFDLAVSHNSYAQIAAAKALGIKSATLMDYEHQPANHLAFRLASKVIVPRAFPAAELRKYGASLRKVKRYQGTKEDVYLADFAPDPAFAETLRKLNIASDDVLVVARPPAREALYHRFENELFDQLLARLNAQPAVKIIVLPRSDAQRKEYQRFGVPPSGGIRDRFVPPEGGTPNVSLHTGKVIIPRQVLDGANLIAAADLVVSAGGTMNREAAALGVPAVSVYAGKWAAIDEELVREGRLQRISSRAEIEGFSISKKSGLNARRATDVRRAVAELILE
jgi:predicted glycosyltransferase